MRRYAIYPVTVWTQSYFKTVFLRYLASRIAEKDMMFFQQSCAPAEKAAVTLLYDGFHFYPLSVLAVVVLV